MKPVRWKTRKSKRVESWTFETTEAAKSIEGSEPAKVSKLVEAVKSVEGCKPIEISKSVEAIETVEAKSSTAKRQRIKFRSTERVESAKAKRMELAETTKALSRETAFEFVSKSTSKATFESEMTRIGG